MLCSSHKWWAVAFLYVLYIYIFLKEIPSTPFTDIYLSIMYHWLHYNLSCQRALESNRHPWGRFDCCAVGRELGSPWLPSCSLKRTPVRVGEALQKCVLSCHPHRTRPYRTSSWQWWLRHLWARLHVFYQETITGVVLRPESLWHSSCHIYCWGVWANDQVDSAGCTTFALNCQLHCECPTVFPL